MSNKEELEAEKDLKLFESECLKWKKKFGLNNTRCQFEIGATDIDSYAEFFFDYSAHTLLITLSDDLPTDKKTELIKESAHHEMIEGGLLGPLITLAMARTYDPQEFEAVVHQLVFRLQELIQ